MENEGADIDVDARSRCGAWRRPWGSAPFVSALVPTRIVNGGTSTVGVNWQYDVAADGRFLINVSADEGNVPITVIQNWNPKR